jgi:ribonuclease PH
LVDRDIDCREAIIYYIVSHRIQPGLTNEATTQEYYYSFARTNRDTTYKYQLACLNSLQAKKMKFPASITLFLCFLSAPFNNENGNADKGWGVAAFAPMQQRRTFAIHSSTSARREAAIVNGDADAAATDADANTQEDAVISLATLLEEVVAEEVVEEVVVPAILETEASFTVETIQREPNVPGPLQRLTFHSIPGQEKGVPPIVLETGKIGRQAAGAIELTRGDTVLYATAARDQSPKDNIDFLPLSVEHQERFSSAGLTSGAYNKRDGRAAEHEILTCRLIDRPLRPLIQNGWRHETQLLSWVLSYDGVRSCDPLAITASAAALYISDVPLTKPVASVMVGYVNGQLIVNPTNAQMEISRLDLTVAGTKDGIMMIEGAADFLPEATMIEAVKFGHDAIIGLCEGIEALGKLAGKEKKLDTIKPPIVGLKERVNELFTDRVDSMYASGTKKAESGTLMSGLQEAVVAELREEYPGEEIAIKGAFKDLLCSRMFILGKEKGLRCDGRQLDQIRCVDMEAGFLPRVHGSALFTRGETQTIATATLGDSGMRQKIDKIDGTEVKRFYLQYTFPPSCVGETGRVGAPGRREVGHGNLAER